MMGVLGRGQGQESKNHKSAVHQGVSVCVCVCMFSPKVNVENHSKDQVKFLQGARQHSEYFRCILIT